MEMPVSFAEFTQLLRDNPFYEFTALLGITAVVAFLGQLFRQPVIVSFIAVGVIVGPSALDIVHSDDSIALLAQLGIAVLLFLVGLKLDVTLIKSLGKVAVATGLGQVVFTALIGFLLCLALGLDTLTSIYVGVALTFSSTIIIVKMLSDKREVDALHGKIAIGFLIVQDIVVVLAMVVLSAIGIGEESQTGLTQTFVQIALGAVCMLLLTAVFVKYLSNPLLDKAANSSEQLLVFAVALAVMFASLGHFLGFSKELGGLLAGVALASTPYREALVTRLASLRDFLLLFFFIALGSQLDLRILGDQLIPAIILSVFVLIGNPIIVMVIMGAMGYRSRTGFLAGLTVAQISEFSLVFIAMGITIGHLQNDALGLVTLVGLITIALSVYMISFSHALYDKFAKYLKLFERKSPVYEDNIAIDGKVSPEIIVCGVGRYGSAISEQLLKHHQDLAVIDFNPEKYRYWRARGVTCYFGDVGDSEFLEHLPLDNCKWFIVTLPRDALGVRFEDPRRQLLENLRSRRFKGKLAMASETETDYDTLEALGVYMVLTPYKDAAEQAAAIISNPADHEWRNSPQQ